MNFYLTHFSLRECMLPRIQHRLWVESLAYLRSTNDPDGWVVLLCGA